MLIPVSARNPPGLWERLASPRGPQGAPPSLARRFPWFLKRLIQPFLPRWVSSASHRRWGDADHGGGELDVLP